MKLKAKQTKSFVAEEVDWAETSSDEEDNEEQANLCLMASSKDSSRVADSNASLASEINTVFDYSNVSISEKECRETLKNMMVDLYPTMNDIQMVEIQKEEVQKKLDACLVEIKELKLQNEQIHQLKHANNELCAINEILNQERGSLMAELNIAKAHVEKWTKSANTVGKIIEARVPN